MLADGCNDWKAQDAGRTATGSSLTYHGWGAPTAFFVRRFAAMERERPV
jgi:hypothetical protein